MTTRIHHVTDIAIIGGGVSGLWLLNLLGKHGFKAALIETKSLGSGQTLASQGMIHGGVKYTLSASTSGAFDTIADMPARWRSCLRGDGTLDLRRVEVLSDDYYMFSDGRLSSKLTAFFGSKALEGSIVPVSRADAPIAFQHPDFTGSLYRLQDLVLDLASLVHALADSHLDRIYTGDCTFNIESRRLRSIQLSTGETLTASRYLLTAGAGNQALIDKLDLPVKMQRRPLHQVIVRGPGLPELYAHAVTLRTADKPRITITTHLDTRGRIVWYLGGELAESGIGRTDAEQISYAREELRRFLPWLDFDHAEFSTYRVDRAEVASGGMRPDTPYVGRFDNITVCWPTKMTLVPLLGDMVLTQLDEPGAGDATFSHSVSFGISPWEHQA